MAIDTAAALAEVEKEIADAENSQPLEDVGDDDGKDPDSDDDDLDEGDESGEGEDGKGKEGADTKEKKEGEEGSEEGDPAKKPDGKEGDDTGKEGDDGKEKEGKEGEEKKPDADEPLEDDDGPTLADGVVVSKVEDFTKLEKEVSAKLDELDKKLEDGDISQSDHAKESRKLNSQLAEAIGDRKTEEARVAADNAAFVREWGRTQKAFFREHPQFTLEKNPTLHRSLDAEIKALSVMDEHQKLTLKQLMETARRNVAKLFNLDPKAKEKEEKGGKPVSDQPGKKDAEKKPAPKLPPSLDDVSGKGEGTESEFAHIDKLKGNARTEAFGKLTKEQQDRFLSGS